MASLAVRVRPPIVTIVALLGLALATRPETHHRHHRCPFLASPPLVVIAGEPVPDVLARPAFADARPWPSGMVMGVPLTHDPIARNALGDLLSGLFQTLTSLGV